MEKIVVIVRTRDEEHRIGQFCLSYANADHILVADGGSIDRTKEVARTYSNVTIRDFPYRTELDNGYWRNNDSDHVNWLIDWARDLAPQWIILDDCDCRPNYLLQRNYRRILSMVEDDFVLVTRLYLWGTKQHFPHLCKPGIGHEKYEPSLWAWRGNIDFKTVNVPPAFTFRIGDLDVKDLHNDAKALDLFPPFCLLHYSWDDPERVMMKVKTYRESGLIPGQMHPLDFGGPLEPLPSWAHE